ncbi:MAG: RNA-processing protein [Candidatus Nanohalarchaeota archaeon]|nr:MAG: RNA-processing protein [Candidatus Nanohaloarchaeota archaeon]
MKEITEFLKIPKSRIGTLIGKNGETKKRLEKELKCRITVSEFGEVDYSSKDSIYQMKLKSIIKAIGRGFTCDEALVLLDDDYVFRMVSLKEYALKSEKKLIRVKSRLIGTDGKSRKIIEQLTDTTVVVFGKTVSVIGKYDDVGTASEAIFMLIEGATHRKVRILLERRAREKKYVL